MYEIAFFLSYHSRVMEWAVKECGFVNLQSKISSVIFLVFFFLQKEYTSTYDYWHIAYCVS